MLAQIYSLKGDKTINEVLKKGIRAQSDSFGTFYINRKDKETPKFAFVVSTKISKLAVHRNRIKRAMSESIRRNVERVPTGINLVFLAKKEIIKKTTDEIMKEVELFVSSGKFK